MQFSYNPAKILKEAKSKVKASNKKKALGKGFKRGLISLAAFAAVTIAVLFLGKAGIEITAEEKRNLISLIVQILAGGGILSASGFVAANLTKKHN